MPKNIEMNYKNLSGSYEVLYPNTQVEGLVDFQDYMSNNYYNKDQVDENTWTIGDIRPTIRDDLSDDWHLCDGTGISGTLYPELFDLKSENWNPFSDCYQSGLFSGGPGSQNGNMLYQVYAVDKVTNIAYTFTYGTSIQIQYKDLNSGGSWKSYSYNSALMRNYNFAVCAVAAYNGNIAFAARPYFGAAGGLYMVYGTHSGDSFSLNEQQISSIGAENATDYNFIDPYFSTTSLITNGEEFFLTCLQLSTTNFTQDTINFKAYRKSFTSGSFSEVISQQLYQNNYITNYQTDQMASIFLNDSTIVVVFRFHGGSGSDEVCKRYGYYWNIESNTLTVFNNASVSNTSRDNFYSLVKWKDNAVFQFMNSDGTVVANYITDTIYKTAINSTNSYMKIRAGIGLIGNRIVIGAYNNSNDTINILVYNINDDGTLTHIIDFTNQTSLKLDGEDYYYTTPMFVQLSELYMIYSWKGSSIYTMPNYPNIPVENDNYYYYIKGK